MPTDLYETFRTAGAYADLTRADFDACLDMVATGGYALRAYDRWQRLKQRPDGLWELRDPRASPPHPHEPRHHSGHRHAESTPEEPHAAAPRLGEIEEGFAAIADARRHLPDRRPGRAVRGPARNDGRGHAPRRQATKDRHLHGHQIRHLDPADPPHPRDVPHKTTGPNLPAHTADWLALQRRVSKLPEADRILVESFPHDGRQHTCIYGFAGRNAMQTLGLLITQRMEDRRACAAGLCLDRLRRADLGSGPRPRPRALFDGENLRDAFETWLAGNAVMKRTFRGTATIAGLLGAQLWASAAQPGRQATFSSDILYDTLIKYDPDHLMLRITREEAMRGLVDFGRIEEMLERTGAASTTSSSTASHRWPRPCSWNPAASRSAAKAASACWPTRRSD